VLLLTGCLILGVLGLGEVEAHAATPSSLEGESFTSHHLEGSTLNGICDMFGGSFRFLVSGTAAAVSRNFHGVGNLHRGRKRCVDRLL
jgi:hypothetical protein